MAIPALRHNALEPELLGLREYGRAVPNDTVAELNAGSAGIAALE
jgi:hypothetical protein